MKIRSLINRIFSSSIKRLASMSGDTIVEVLIAFAVISTVLIGAHITSNRSSNVLRDTQEHQEALALASSQLEQLRAHNGLSTPSGNGCFDQEGAAADPGGAGCDYWSDGTSSCTNATSPYCYKVLLTVISSDSPNTTSPTLDTTYKVAISWDSLFSGQSVASLFYRVPIVNLQYAGPSSMPGPDDDGMPDIGPAPCTVDCTLPPGHVPGYHYSYSFVNRTTEIPALQITGCKWDFGDGTVVTNTACQNTDVIGHSFKHILASHPYPADCIGKTGAQRQNYTVRLTINLTSGKVSNPAIYSVSTPNCW